MCARRGDVLGELAGGEPAPLDEDFERDEQRVAGEGGDGGIRRGAVTDWVEREHLPETLFGGGEEIGEGKGSGAEVADAAGGVERRDVEEKAGGAIKGQSDWPSRRSRLRRVSLGRLPLVATVWFYRVIEKVLRDFMMHLPLRKSGGSQALAIARPSRCSGVQDGTPRLERNHISKSEIWGIHVFAVRG
jgi:hypothetical protein